MHYRRNGTQGTYDTQEKPENSHDTRSKSTQIEARKKKTTHV